MDDKYIAYILFKEGISGQEIARIMKRSEQTISIWKKNGAWEQKATEDLMAMQTIHEDIRDLVRYQLLQLRKLKDQYIKSEADGGEPRLIGQRGHRRGAGPLQHDKAEGNRLDGIGQDCTEDQQVPYGQLSCFGT